jgi:hypothetical protein
MSTLDDFFGPCDDGDGATCLYCEVNSNEDHEGQWVTNDLWVCSDHVGQHQTDQAKQAQRSAASAERGLTLAEDPENFD